MASSSGNSRTGSQDDLRRLEILRDALQTNITEGCVSIDSFLGKVSADDVFKRYDVDNVVAKGGMGAIFAVRDLNIQRSVAMKVMLKKPLPNDPKTLRFIHEAQVTGQLEHPNIVPVHELAVESGGNVFYTMKYVRGVTLEEILEKLRASDPAVMATFTLTRLLTIFQKACDAVAFAHSRGVIHRDLKPDNIMIGEYGEVLVMDWGIAKVVEQGPAAPGQPPPSAPPPGPAQRSPTTVLSRDSVSFVEEQSVTGEGVILGTPMYMAPEQATGRKDLDHRADIYTLGGILHSILTLDLPIRAKSMNELMIKKVNGEVIPPVQYSADHSWRRKLAAEDVPILPHHCPQQKVPESLSAVAVKALAVAPEARYQSVVELQAELESWQAGFATQAEDASLLKQLTLMIRRHWAETLIAVVALITLVVVVFGFMVAVIKARNTALANLANFQNEQLAKKEVSLRAAPKFVSEARRLIPEQRWEESLEMSEAAIQLDPELAEAVIEKARVQFGLLDYAAASDSLLQADKLAKTEAQRAQIKKLREMNELYAELARIDHGTLSTENQVRLAETFAKQGETSFALYHYRTCIAGRLAAKDHAGALKAAVSFLAWRNPTQRKLNALSEVTGDKVSLDLRGNSELNDLEPLTGLPLTHLNLEDCRSLTNLKAVTGMPLRVLNLANTGVADLAPLAGMPLTELHLTKTKVRDLLPLDNMPLETLSLRSTLVSDLTPLRLLPLHYLDISYSDAIRDLSPLGNCPLQSLNMDYVSSVRDLDALRGHKLKYLTMEWTRVSDLKPLAGMPLEELNLAQAQSLAEVDALAGLPLKKLNLNGCRRLNDLRPLLRCPDLVTLIVPTQVKDLAFLRELPRLKYLSDTAATQPVEQFLKSRGL